MTSRELGEERLAVDTMLRHAADVGRAGEYGVAYGLLRGTLEGFLRRVQAAVIALHKAEGAALRGEVPADEGSDQA